MTKKEVRENNDDLSEILLDQVQSTSDVAFREFINTNGNDSGNFLFNAASSGAKDAVRYATHLPRDVTDISVYLSLTSNFNFKYSQVAAPNGG